MTGVHKVYTDWDEEAKKWKDKLKELLLKNWWKKTLDNRW
jgi:hypothetical protein